MTIVIGLCGAKGSGKDYFFKILKQKYSSKDIRKIAYADLIKHKVMFLFGLKSEEEYDAFKRTHISFGILGTNNTCDGRHIVREIGMMMRDYDHNQFVRYVENTIKASPNTIWCITDLRFMNELASICKLKGLVVKINRDGIDYDGHITETEFSDDQCDYVITNNSTLEAYQQKIVDVFEHIIGRKRP